MPFVSITINNRREKHFEASLYAIPHLLCTMFYPNSTDKKANQIDRILDKICNVCFVDKKDILGRSRKHELVAVRQLFFYIAYSSTNYSLKRIGSIAGRDHTTVIHSINKVKDAIETRDANIVSLIKKISPGLLEVYNAKLVNMNSNYEKRRIEKVRL